MCSVVPFVNFPVASPSPVQVLTAAPSQLTCFPLDLSCSLVLPQWANFLIALGAILLAIIVIAMCCCCGGVVALFTEVLATAGIKRAIVANRANKLKKLKAKQARKEAQASKV